MVTPERLTPECRRVLKYADDEAARYGHEYIGTEHLLLGLLKEEACVTVRALQSLGVDAAKVRGEIDKIIKGGPDLPPLNIERPQTPAARRAIAYAREEADDLGHNYVGTAHLLLGLFRETEALAAAVLTNLGLTLDRVRHQIGRMLPEDEHSETQRMVGNMYSRFTDRARKVMQLANQEAQRLHHEYIGTEHILLGLVKEGSGVAANVLKNLDVDLRKIRLEVEKIVQAGPDDATLSKMPQTPRAKKVVEYAIEEARNLNHAYVGTEHLLLGLLREDEGVAAQVLVNLGLKLQGVRDEILQMLGHTEVPREASGASSITLSSGAAPAVGAQESAGFFARFTPNVLQILKEIVGKLDKLNMEKEAAVAEQDFEKAAQLRDQADRLKRKVELAFEKLRDILGESDETT